MTLEALGEKLKVVGVPVAYNVFKTPQTVPYICYIITNSDNLIADGSVYIRIDKVQIELYTKDKDTTLELKLEQALSDFHYQSNEDYIESENIYLKTYEIQI